MRIHVLLSWYDERPAWLAATIASCAPFADSVVAVDGAYAMFPEGQPRSSTDQAEAIRETSRALGLGCTIVEPQRAWMGNEVEKRSALFRVAEALAEPLTDWYFIMDGDQLVHRLRCDLKARLAGTERDTGEAMFVNGRSHFSPEERPFLSPMVEQQGAVRMMFRAMPGLRVEGTHQHYVTPDGRIQWGQAPSERAEDFQDDVVIEHRNHLRDLYRNRQREGYYQRRTELDLEKV